MRKRRAILLAPEEIAEHASAIGGARSLSLAPVMQSGRFLGAIELADPIDGGAVQRARRQRHHVHGRAVRRVRRRRAASSWCATRTPGFHQRSVTPRLRRMVTCSAASPRWFARLRPWKARGAIVCSRRAAARRARRGLRARVLHVPHDAPGRAASASNPSSRRRSRSPTRRPIASTSASSTQDNVVFAIADPAQLAELTERWLPTAQRETPDRARHPRARRTRTTCSPSRRAPAARGAKKKLSAASSSQRMCGDMDSASSRPTSSAISTTSTTAGRATLVSYWQKRVRDGPPLPRRRVARHRSHRERRRCRALRGEPAQRRAA